MIARLIRRVMTWKKGHRLSRRTVAVFVVLLVALWMFGRNVDRHGFSPRRAEVRRMMNAEAKACGGLCRYGEIRGPLTVEDVEQELFRGPVDVTDVADSPLRQMFRQDWIQFRSNYENGDELYFFKTDTKSWRRLAGRKGYILIRQDKIVTRIVTAMN